MRTAFILFVLVTIYSCGSKPKEENKTDTLTTTALRLEKEHPAGFFEEAAQEFKVGKIHDAGFLFYLGQLRFKYYLKSNPDLSPSGDPALYGALFSTVGGALNPELIKDYDGYLSILDSVIAWDKNHDFEFFSKTKFPDKQKETLDGLIKYRQYVVDNKKELIESSKPNKVDSSFNKNKSKDSLRK